ncbi:MAG: hypothetical protein IJI53_09785 [Clostridia bacterium]|nr:hypothetical protein [Clostridia bacterium]MBR0408313.1 hypothetical protein [Clostridia bacterium]
MKSDVIVIDNAGKGFENAVTETRKAAAYHGLSGKDALHLELMAEETLSLVRSVTGEMQASFWIEAEGPRYDLHLTTKTVMDKEKRALLISAASSRKNEAAKTFLGSLRDAFEKAMAADTDHWGNDLPIEVLNDLPNHPIQDQDWDGYERSVLRKVADNVKISIRGGVVDMTVSKDFTK